MIMRLTLQEILHTCDNWEEFCRLHGFSEWAVNEGGGDVAVELDAQQAHHLGIITLPEWKVKPKEEVYPPNPTGQTRPTTEENRMPAKKQRSERKAKPSGQLEGRSLHPVVLPINSENQSER